MLKNFHKLYDAQGTTPGAVVHVGAGLCGELADYQHLGFEAIHLIEANPELTEKLAVKLKAIPNATVNNLVIAPNSGTAAFTRTSNPRFDSLNKPAAIKQYYPNIKIISEENVKTTSLNSLLEAKKLDAEKDNILVIELQGAESEVLGHTSPKNLQCFSWIVVKTSAEVLYETSQSNADLNNIMTQSCFEQIFTEELTFPFLEKIFKRNNYAKLLSENPLALSSAKSPIDKLKNENEIISDELTSRAEEFEEAISKRDLLINTLTTSKEKLQEDIHFLSTHSQKMKKKLKTLSSERAKLESIATERSGRISQLESLQSELESRTSSHLQTVSKLQNENHGLITQTVKIKSQKESAESELSQLKNANSALKEKNELWEIKHKALERTHSQSRTIEKILKEESRILKHENSSLKNQLKESAAQESQLKLSYDQSASKVKQLELNKADLENNITELKKHNENLGAELNDRSSESEKLQAHKLQLASEASQLKDRLNELTSQVTNLESGNKEHQETISTLSDENEKIKRDSDYISGENSKLKDQVLTLNNSVNMNSKLLIKAGIDNDALREKYSEKLDSEQSLLELISNLRDRLEAAAKFYGHLEEKHPEIVLEEQKITTDRNYE